MCVNMPMLQILIVILTVKCVVSDSFTEPENNRTDLAFKSKIHTNAVCTTTNCISNYCVGRSDDSSDPVKILSASSLEDECKIPTSFPDKGDNSNGYVTYNDNNQLNCSVNYTVDPSEISNYTLTFWVYNNCTSSSNCSFTLSSTDDIPVVVKFVGRTVSVKTQEFNSSRGGWIFVVLRKSNQISTVFINDRDQTTSELPSTLKQLTIQSTSIESGQVFSLVDVRLFKNILTNREINQIYTNSAKLDDVYPHSECRCPETHPKINTTESYYSLQCENENGDLANRFTTDSVVEYIIDNNENTGWKTSQENVLLTIQLEAEYQIDEIEVIMKTTPCNVTLTLDSGHQEIFMNTKDVKWMNITNSIQKRSQLLNVVTRNITVLISGFCNTSISNHQITEILITGRCNCHGNAGSCTYQSDSYTCSCTSNTTGSDCGTCATNYYRQTKDFGCSYMCQCNTMGTDNSAQTCDEIEGQCQCKGNVEGRTCDTCKHLHYNLSSSNPNGCTRSPCYENGTTRCSDNATCATCDCKTNVKGSNCDECEQNHYGINVLADGCVPCHCNISGTLSRDLSCDLTTGQCNCKLHVKGRKCNQCKDGYYSFSGDHTGGCLECLCNRYGSRNKNCDHITGQCHCVEERTNRQCDPYIESIVPAYGPQAGGTIVTVTGQLLGAGEIRFEIYEDSALPYNITSLNQTEVVFITKKSSSASIQLTFIWREAYENGLDKKEHKHFNFNKNPVINQVYLTASFKSGGCDVKFTGSSLDSVYKPYLNSYIAGTIKITDCRHVGTTTLICQSPVLVGYSDTSYTYGLFLDGVTSYENLTGQFNDKATVKLADDPDVTAKEYEDYKMLFSDTITIQGSKLKEACEDNLNVAVGNVNCVIQSVNNEQIVCKPDLSFPGINQDSSDVMVTIGNFKKSAGRIKLILFWKTMEFIGIAIGVCVLVIIIIVIVICCFCRRHRKNYDSSSTNKNKAQNGFDLPIEKQEVLRFSNRHYCENLEKALSHDETDHSEDFLLKLESSVRERIQKSVSDRKNIQPEKVCIFKGTEIRVINGKFSQDSANAGKELTIKTNVKTLKDLLNGRKYPPWMNNGLMECIKLQDCFHDNILRSLGISIDQNRFYVLYPLSTRGFKEYLNDAKHDFSIRELLEMCVQVAQGMIYLSNENLVHKDLATRNCVVMPDGTVKISDSSFSWNLYPIEYMYDELRQRYLPIRWMALECLKMGYYDISSDVWSYGILLWEVMTLSLYLPYHDQKSDASIKNHIDEGFRLGKPTNAPDELYTLMVNCWEAENHHRPSFEEIVTELNEVMNPESVYINLDSTVKGNDMPSSVPHRGASVNRGYQL